MNQSFEVKKLVSQTPSAWPRATPRPMAPLALALRKDRAEKAVGLAKVICAAGLL